MECLYLPELENLNIEFEISGSESRHLRALRLGHSDLIMATNGRGAVFTLALRNIDKKYFAVATEKFTMMGEPKRKIGLALGMMSVRDRFEFAIEKAVELGVSDIFLLDSKHSQKKKVNIERLEQKIIAAIKQSKRSFLPKICNPTPIKNVLDLAQGYDRYILADPDGKEPELSGNSSVLIFIGPEGGFSDDEVDEIRSSGKTTEWRLASSRLRAETAVVSALAIANIL